MREIQVTLVGNVVDQPRHIQTSNGGLTTFRLAQTPRTYRDGEWVDGTTSYFEITCFKRLGENVAGSVSRGEPVVVHGRLSIREWEREDRKGREVQVIAQHVGHDLSLGVSTFRRPGRPIGTEEQPAAAVQDDDAAVPDAA